VSTDYSSQPPSDPVPPRPPPPQPMFTTNLIIFIVLGSVFSLFMFCCVGLTAISFLGQVSNKTFSNVQSVIQATGS
jgi:hypothetical protein